MGADATFQLTFPCDADVAAALTAPIPQPLPAAQDLIMVIDPAAGGPQSDFALITFFRHRGQLVVRHERMYSTLSSRSSSSGRMVSLTRKRPMRSPRSTCRNRAALCGHTGCSPSAAPDCGCSTQ